MTRITLRVLDGADRGQVYDHLQTPITIGREEGNSVQLNDERISRFHLKIQEDQDKLVLTDLESTNGTRVNGRTVSHHRLRPGDRITIGASLMRVDVVGLAQLERADEFLARKRAIATRLAELLAGLLLPLGPLPAILGFSGDLVLFAYLLGLARFATNGQSMGGIEKDNRGRAATRLRTAGMKLKSALDLGGQLSPEAAAPLRETSLDSLKDLKLGESADH